MKYINKILSLFMIALIAASCDPDAESYTPGKLEEGNQEICFVGNYTQTVEVEPGISSFDLILTRALTDAVGAADVTVINNDENIFVCPSTVSFAAGEETAKLTVKAPAAAEGITYNLRLALEGENISNYSSGYHEVSVNFTILKWESIGTGYYLDGAVSNFFGVDASLPLAVEIEKTTTATSTRFRFDSPFAKVATEQDEIGGFNGYPYNEESDVVPGEYVFIIDVTKDGASLKPVDLGMAWAYGMFSVGTVYGNLSNNISSYPLGIYNEKAGSITFPASSLYVSMADYKDGGKYPCNNPSYLYLSAEAYLNSLESE